MTVPALTVNKVCLSGLNAIATAAQYVELGQAGLLVAGGMESMSDAPYLVPRPAGARMGDAELVDAMVHDGLWDAFDDLGGLSDQVNQRLGIDRAAQDEVGGPLPRTGRRGDQERPAGRGDHPGDRPQAPRTT